jgi:hypothetical protein
MKALLREERPVKDSVKIFMANTGGVGPDEIRQAFLPVVVNDVQIYAGKPSLLCSLRLQTRLAFLQSLPPRA